MFRLNKHSIKNKYFFWGGVLLIWAGVIAGTLWSKGYQHQSSRSFTNEEMIRIAVQRAMQRMLLDSPKAIRISSDEIFKQVFIVPYKDVDHFLEENPGCCYIKRAFGAKYVTVYAKAFYKDKSGQIHRGEFRVSSGDFFPNSIRYMP